ncbi:DMT family transporter [Streptomyces sp. 2A115]|uniref:DMT family transporter n=1 Tax=Streptomyces sp. 2A115 TaxID=3457439 RepID=UPI003FD61F3B
MSTELQLSLRGFKTLEVGTVYVIWAGVGTAPIAASGMLFLRESANAAKLLDIALVIAGMGRFNTCA